jgi:hypothetical protein
MTLRNILIPAYHDDGCDHQLGAALNVVSKAKAHIKVLFVQPIVETIMATLPDVVRAAGVTREVVAREGREAAAAAPGPKRPVISRRSSPGMAA